MRRSVRFALAAVALGSAAALALPLVARFIGVNPPVAHLLGIARPQGTSATRTGQLVVPPGFQVSNWADGMPGARFLRFTPTGDLLVSRPQAGQVLLLEPDRDGDGRHDRGHILMRDLDRPHGIDLHDGWLYIAEGTAIARVRFDVSARTTSGAVERIVTGLPTGGHWTRTLRFGPDGLLYLSMGSSCNVCIETDPRRAAITRYTPDGKNEEVYASGLRNAVGFTFEAGTGDMYATDNGRDWLGDDFPPCELNRVVRGGFYGWPFANGNKIADPDHGAGHEADVARSLPPVHEFGAHIAPLGLGFVTGASWPAEYRGALLVAQHGSWNRSKKSGYQVVSLHRQADGKFAEKPFVTGFEKNDDVMGRPVDVAEGPDGAVYVSDDAGGAVWRVSYGEAPRAAAATAALAPPAVKAAPAAVPSDAEAAARGRALFGKLQCVSCHAGRPLRGLSAKYDLAALSSFLRAPTPPMPVPQIGDDERRDLATFLLSEPTFR